MVQMHLTAPRPEERSSAVMLRCAQHLCAYRDRPFAALRVTRSDCSNCQVLFFKIEPCLKSIIVERIPHSRRTNQKERTRRANKGIRFRRKLVALQIQNRLLQFIIEALLLLLGQFNLERLARTHVVNEQFNVPPWLVLS